jgi:hypothetical protein
VWIVDGTRALGTLRSGQKQELEFAVRNGAKTPVSIVSIRKSCSCEEIAFDYQKDPIAPGETGKVRCEFLPQSGPQRLEGFIGFSNGGGDRIAVTYVGTYPFALSASFVTWDAVAQGRSSSARVVKVFGDRRYAGKHADVSLLDGKPKWLDCVFEQKARVALSGRDDAGDARVELGQMVFTLTSDAPSGMLRGIINVKLVVEDEIRYFAVGFLGNVAPAPTTGTLSGSNTVLGR